MADTTLVNSAIFNGSTASAEINKPVDTAEDDILFALVHRHTATEPNSVPAGWTKLAWHSGALGGIGLYYKVAGAAEPGTYTWGWAASAWTKISNVTYRDGFDINDPIDVLSNTPYVVNNDILRAASMNVTNSNSTLIFAGGLYHTSLVTFTKPITQDNDWEEDFDDYDVSNDLAHTFCHCNWSSSGASDVIDVTMSLNRTPKHAFAVALNVSAAEEAVNTMMMQQSFG